MISEPKYKEIEYKVMTRIEHVRIVRARTRGAIHGGVVLISIVGFIPTIEYISTRAYNSGFADYASLFVSDTSYAVGNIKTVLLSLAESMPTLEIALALGILFVGGNSVKRSISSFSSRRKNSKYSSGYTLA